MSALKALVIGLVAVLAALVSWIVDVIEKYGADEHQTDELVELAEKCLGQGDGYEYKIEKRADGSFVVKCAKGLGSDNVLKTMASELGGSNARSSSISDNWTATVDPDGHVTFH